jgi:hypothetical protein
MMVHEMVKKLVKNPVGANAACLVGVSVPVAAAEISMGVSFCCTFVAFCGIPTAVAVPPRAIHAAEVYDPVWEVQMENGLLRT